MTHKGRFQYSVSDHVGTDGHTAWELYNCPPDFECLAGGPITFALPTKSQSSWAAFNEQFEILGPRTLRMLGEEMNATLIRGTKAAGQTYYLYSSDRGLLGFGASGVKGAPLFWLVGRCGFAASARKVRQVQTSSLPPVLAYNLRFPSPIPCSQDRDVQTYTELTDREADAVCGRQGLQVPPAVTTVCCGV
jgi:hypothetical protein